LININVDSELMTGVHVKDIIVYSPTYPVSTLRASVMMVRSKGIRELRAGVRL
jgi:hypothetical protein